MAPASKATRSAANALLQRITALDRSRNRFSLQLVEAYSLVDLDLETVSVYYSHIGAAAEAHHGFSPKEEWVLRWLLKRCDEEVAGLESPCLNPNAWTLLRIIAARLPTVVIARLLNSHNFTLIVEQTFQWLWTQVQTTGPSELFPKTGLSPQRPLSRESSSSITAQEGLSADVKKSRKRKRENIGSWTHETDNTKSFDVLALHFSICSALRQLKARTVSISSGRDEFAAEHLKAALKTTVKQSSRILGGFFGSLIGVLETIMDRAQDEKNERAANIYEDLMQPVVELWSLSSSPPETIAGSESARAFSAECLLPALRLLTVLQNRDVIIAGRDKLLETIETLLAVHIILPSRNAFIHGTRSPKGNEEVPTAVLQELLTPLAEAVSEELKASPSLAKMSSLIGTIPLLFSVAVKHGELNTPKQRIAESPWLRAFFFQLAECAIFNFPVSQPIGSADHCLDVLEDMLRVAVGCKLVLDVSILQSIVLFLTGVTGVGSQPGVRWNLISLCIENDPHFVIALPAKNNPSESTAALNTDVLDCILVKLTRLGFKDCDLDSREYGVMLRGVILPLLHGFVRARNLSGFIDVWKQQIILWERTKASYLESQLLSNYATSIWEDEALLQAVSEGVEVALTEGQILRILQQGLTGKNSLGDHESSNVAETMAEITILDCFINGIKMESTTLALKNQLMMLLESFSVANEEGLSESYSWRIWRILATAARYWSSNDLGSPTSTALLAIRVRAQEQLQSSVAVTAQGLQMPASYAKALFAFHFLITSPGSFGRSGYDASLPLILAVQTIVDSMRRFADSMFEGKGDGIDRSEPFVAWDGQRCSLKTQYILTLACAAQLALAPETMSCFQTDILNDFLEGLFRCASLQPFPRSTNVPQITYRHVWEELLSSGALLEYRPLADSVGKTLAENFISVEVESNLSTRNGREELALSGLHKVPFDALKAYNRNRIFQQASSRLLSSELTVSPTSYLTLLVHYIPHIKKATDVVSDPHYFWKMAEALDSGISKTTPDAVVAFRQFVSKSLKLARKKCIDLQAMEFLENILGTLQQHITTNPQSLKYVNLVLTSDSLGELSSSWDEMPSPFREDNYQLIQRLRIVNFDRLLNYLKESDLRCAAVAWKWGPLLESIAANIDLLKVEPATAEGREYRLTTLSGLVESVRSIAEHEADLSLVEEVASSTVYDNLVIVEKISNILTDDCQRQSGSRMLGQIGNADKFRTPRAKQSWLQYLVETHRSLNLERQVEALAELAQSIIGRISDNNLLVYLPRIMNYSYGPEARIPALKFVLAQLFAVLCETLAHSSNRGSCILVMHCLDLLMIKNAWAISQWHVDSLLSTISTITAISGPQTGSDSDIFTCLTRVFGTLLAVHRSKLGGRYHLVVLALQGMLRCLFTPYTSSFRSSHHLQRPTRLKNTKLEAEHAAAYARLLSSICDPGVSAVTRSRNRARQELNDETKKARSIAGQHLQYLVMEFCQCQLQGRIEPEVRRALDPGLYAVFDAMSQDVMRTVNSALDAPGRAIFKLVYDDYRRFGRWQGA